MRSLRKRSVILLCMFTPFWASLPAMAQQAKSGSSSFPREDRALSLQTASKAMIENIGQWRRQANQASLTGVPSKELFQADRQLQKLRSLSGGPGMDGGGGETVLSQTGEVRFLDLAKAEGLQLKNFDKEIYERQLLKFGEEVTPQGQLVPANDFFSCGIEMLQRQDNLLLRALPKLLNLQVVFSNLPLEAVSQGLLRIPFFSSSGWTYEISSLPQQMLLSPSLDPQLQRPIASYANQSANGVASSLMKSRTLLVNSQLHQLLPNLDQCALQVHEIFRFLGYAGGDMPLSLVTSPFTTQEIESLTVRVMKQEPIVLTEIPATNLFRALAIIGKETLMKMSVEEMAAAEKILNEQRVTTNKEDSTSTLATLEALHLFQAQTRAEQNLGLGEEAILEVGRKNPQTRAAAIRRQLNEKLNGAPLRLSEVMKGVHDMGDATEPWFTIQLDTRNGPP